MRAKLKLAFLNEHFALLCGLIVLTLPIQAAPPNDLHPDPNITLQKSASPYEEGMSITAGDWDGQKYFNFRFNCPSCSFERLLGFLYKDSDHKWAQVEGGNL